MDRYRNWVFTWYKHTDEESSILQYFQEISELRYVILQKEECPSTQRLHWQGYMEFKQPKYMTTLKKLLPGIHLEMRKGTQVEAIKYASKEETRLSGPYRHGACARESQGSRSDLKAVGHSIMLGLGAQQIFEQHPSAYLRYHAGIHRAMNFYVPVRKWMTQLAVVIGPPGVGKTTLVQSLYPTAYWKDQTKWWHNYQGQSIVVLDEFNGYLPVTTMNRLAGCSTAMAVEVKNGFAPFVAKKIVLISNVGVDKWWNWDTIRTPKGSILRRINELIIVKSYERREFYYKDAIKLHINEY